MAPNASSYPIRKSATSWSSLRSRSSGPWAVMRPRPDGAWSAEASIRGPPTLTPSVGGSSVSQRIDDASEHVAIRVATEEEVEVGVAGDLDQRVAARLQAVEPGERSLLAARQEAAVGRSGEERPARPVARR